MRTMFPLSFVTCRLVSVQKIINETKTYETVDVRKFAIARPTFNGVSRLKSTKSIFLFPFRRLFAVLLTNSFLVPHWEVGSSNSTGNLATETTLSSPELTAAELTEAFEYLIAKLTKQSRTENPTCSLRIFYKVGNSPSPKFIQDVLDGFSSRNLVTTIIPTMHLHNFSTFLSVCGIRHE